MGGLPKARLRIYVIVDVGTIIISADPEKKSERRLVTVNVQMLNRTEM